MIVISYSIDLKKSGSHLRINIEDPLLTDNDQNTKRE
jgi:hypothetical protein